MGTFTPNLSLYKPTRGEVDWDDEVNANFDTLDGILEPPVQIGDALDLDTRPKQLQLSQVFETGSSSTAEFGMHIEARVRGTSPSGPAKSFFGSVTTIYDHDSVGNWTITGAANNGSGLIRITAAGHTITTGDSVGVYGVTGTTEANGQWIATVISSTQVDLQGSSFTNTYISGGTITNRGAFYGSLVHVGPTVERGGLTGTAEFGDDVNGIAVFNGGSERGLSAFLVSDGGLDRDWAGCFVSEANAESCLAMIGEYDFGVDTNGSGLASYNFGAILLPNNVGVYAANAAADNYIELFSCNTLDELQVFRTARFSGSIILSASSTVADGADFFLGTSTGSKIGTSTSQKLGFWNKTPVTQPNTTGTTTGFTAGAGTTVVSGSTFTGNTGSAAYTIGDIVKALKDVGLMAA